MSYIDDRMWYVVNEGTTVAFEDRFSGDTIRLPIEVFDALVMMRYAQLVEQPIPLTARAIDVCGLYRSLGSEALRRWVGLPSLLEDILRKEP